MFAFKELLPTAVLFDPVVEPAAPDPTAVLSLAVVIEPRAALPSPVL